jgi:DNA polymerase-1
MKKKFLLIDSNSVIHRAFHALPPLTTKKGEPSGAIYGFLLVFFKTIRDFQPDFAVACFDFPAPTFRHEKFKEYKATRPPTPKELSSQIPKVKKVLKLFKIPVLEKKGFEADDILGTISNLASQKISEIETVILSGDLDNLQLIDDKTRVFALRRGVKNAILYDKTQVKDRFNILPEQIIDFKALRGDPSDNIPGVPGIGEKTATQLLNKFKNLENLYKELEKESPKSKEVNPKLRRLLLENKEKAFLSKSLAIIKQDVPLTFNFKNAQWGNYKKEEVLKFFKELGFNSLIKRLDELDQGSQKKKENLTLW